MRYNLWAREANWNNYWKSDETKGYGMYFPKERYTIVTQHVRNIEMLKATQNEQLRRSLLGNEEIATRLTTPVNEIGTNWCGKSRGRRSFWTRDAYGTCAVIQKANRKVSGEKANTKSYLQVCAVVNSVREAELKNYGQAMRSSQKDKWFITVKEQLGALNKNGVLGCGCATQGQSRFAHEMIV